MDASPPTRVERLRAVAAARHVPLATILVSITTVGCAYLLALLAYRLRDVLLIMVIAGFIALFLNPLVVFVQRGVPRRGAAVAVVTLCSLVVFIALVVAFGYPLANALTHLARGLPGYVRDASQGQGWIGHLVRRFHLQAWVVRNAPKLQTLGTSLAKPALAVGKGAASLLATLVTIVALVILLMLEGPKMRGALLGAMSPDRASRYRRVAREISDSVSGYMLGDLLTSLIAGVVVFVTLVILGVPFPLLWAVWVALVDFLPMVGGALAGIPTVLFAAGHSLTAGIVTAVVFITYQEIKNHVCGRPPRPAAPSIPMSSHRRLVRIARIALLIALVSGLFGLLPQLGGVTREAAALRHARPALMVASVLAQGLSLASYALLYRSLLASLGAKIRFRLVADVIMASFLVSHLAPFGAAAYLRLRLLR